MKPKSNNLLIVEDNSFIRKSLFSATKNLRGVGEVCSTKSLLEAISFLTTTNFELIILDLKLPDGSGLELLKLLKEKQIAGKVFVFSVSTELRKTSLRYGAFAFFDKAKDFDGLIEAISKA